MSRDIERRLSRLVMIVTVSETDAINRRLKVVYGDENTDSGWIPWPADYGKNYTRWRPVRAQSQLVLLSPNGDVSRAVVAGMLYTQDIAPPSDSDTLDVIEFEDGTKLQYDSEAKTLTIDCAGDVSVTATGDATIDAVNVDVKASGDAAVTGATVTLNEGNAGGVVCQSHLCAFTSAAHPQASVTVKAGN